MIIAAVLEIALLLVLPQLAGLLVTRFVRRASALTWPAAAIATFGVVFYWTQWVPARDAAENAPGRCGMWVLAFGFGLLVGLVVHLGVGILLGRLARRLRQSKRP